MERTVLVVSSDLMVSSQLSGAIRSLGCHCRVVAPQLALVENLPENLSLAILDLAARALEPVELVSQLRRRFGESLRVIAFGPHVHKASLETAGEAGCDEVLTRGQMMSTLAEVLQRQLGDQDTNGNER